MATITGTHDGETLTETAGNDVISALGGDDVVIFNQGGQATESADGGPGSDRLVVDFRNVPGGGGNFGSSSAGFSFIPSSGGKIITFANFEHFSFYRNVSRVNGDGVGGGAGDDLYSYPVSNDPPQFHPSRISHVNLGAGLNDRLLIDASAVTSWFVGNAVDDSYPPHMNMMRFHVSGSTRISYTNIERLELIGSSNADQVLGLTGNDNLDGRGGNDTLQGAGGDDRVIGGEGDDTLTGGEGNDVLVAAIGTDTADGGEGHDQLEIDARGRGLAVSLSISGGPTYSGNFSWAPGSVAYSGIEGFIVYSDAGSHADNVQTGDGDDVFHHRGLNDLAYLLDTVDLAGGTNDLLVADFSAVTDHVVSNRDHPSAAGRYLFDVGGNGKIDYAGVERLHFVGGAQGDTVTGHEGDDILDGRAGDDTLDGGDGNDDLAGSIGTNSLQGGDGDDVIRSASLAIDTVEGGSGVDTAIIDYSSLTVAVTNLAGGEVAFGNGTDSRVILTGVERIVITTGSGNDSITTLGGDDHIDGGAGADAMAGGAGDDTYVVDDGGDSVTEAGGAGTDEIRSSLATYILPANVENLVAASHVNHDFRGNSGNNRVIGGGGADFFRLQDGGNDSVFGDLGNDAFYFGAAYTPDDVADGGVDRDQVALQGNYALTLGTVTGIEDLILLSGTDTRFGDPGASLYSYAITSIDSNVAAGQRLVVDGSQLVAGESFTFDGSAETNGKFILSGGDGIDTLTGGAGADGFYFRHGTFWGPNDKVTGGANDQIGFRGDFTGANKVVMGADQIMGVVTLVLMSGTDSRFGPAVAPTRFDIQMHDGNVGAGQRFTIDGSFLGSDETMRIDGSGETNGFFRMFGGSGADVLIGGAGNDSLRGNGGGDTLTGNGGSDRFVYGSASESIGFPFDRILDFTPGTDKIDLTAIDASSHATGDQAFQWIGSNAFTGSGAGSAGQLRAYQSGASWFVEADTNGNGVADLVIELTLQGPILLGAGDFLL